MIEFQIIEYCFTEFLIEKDTLKRYKITINKDHGHLVFNKSQGEVIRILIMDGFCYDLIKFDLRICAIHIIIIHPNKSEWVSVQIDYLIMKID